MNELEIKKVPFMGTDLMAARDNDGTIWAGVRWMCEGIGLTKGQMQNERLKIKKDMVLSKGERNFVLPSKSGEQETLCLKLDFVPHHAHDGAGDTGDGGAVDGIPAESKGRAGGGVPPCGCYT